MKDQKGMGLLMLILCIMIIALSVTGIIYFVQTEWEKEKIETYKTDMLSIQGKVKVLSQEATRQKNEELLKGKKVEDDIEIEEIKNLLENKIISQEEPNFSSYYIWEKENLEEIGLTNIKLENGFYIVNYKTNEIIYSKGIKVKDHIYYKLSELKIQKEQKDER